MSDAAPQLLSAPDAGPAESAAPVAPVAVISPLPEPAPEAPAVPPVPVEAAPVPEVAPVVEAAPVVVEAAPVPEAAPAPVVVEAAPALAVVAPVVEAAPAPPVEVPAPVEAATPAPKKEEEPPASPDIQEPRYWRKNGWIAKVIKNEDDDGWAVEVSREGDSEPVLVSPWTMGRDKKNPKPFDAPSFGYMVKTATEVMRRTAQQRERMLHKEVMVHREEGSYKVTLDIIPEEDDPHAFLAARNEEGEVVAKIRVAPNYKLTQTAADKWIRNNFKE